MAKVKALSEASYKKMTDAEYHTARGKLAGYAARHADRTLGKGASAREWNVAFFARMDEMCRERGLIR